PAQAAVPNSTAANAPTRRWLRPLKDEQHVIGRNVKRIRRRLERMRQSMLSSDERASTRREPRTAVLLKLAFGATKSAEPAPLSWPAVRLHTEVQPEGLTLLPESDSFENAHILLSKGSWSRVDIADGILTHPEEY